MEKIRDKCRDFYVLCDHDDYPSMWTWSNALVTPLRKAASYEQRKTNLGNLNFWRRIITIAMYPRRHVHVHVGETAVQRADFTWQNFQKVSRI